MNPVSMKDTAVTALRIELPEYVVEEIVATVMNRVIERLNLDPDPTPRWMSISTAAKYLDCSVERLRKLVRTGAVPFDQEAPGCRIFFDRHALDRWMEAKAA
jgi:excisionase family DNA binding protein